MRNLLLSLLLAVALWSCTSKPKQPPFVPTQIAKIKVQADGAIFLDEKPVSLEDLRAELEKLSKVKGAAVYYYRENPKGKPHPAAAITGVLKAIMEARLPVRLSTKPDYSDSVGP